MSVDLLHSDLLGEDPDLGPIVEAFVADLTRARSEVEPALEGGDVWTLVRVGHQYKGSGGGHGFPAVSAAAATLEQAARQDGTVTAAVRDAAARFLEVAARVRAGTG